MTTVTLEEAQTQLAELVSRLAAGETIVIVKDLKPVAQLVAPQSASPALPFGCMKDMLTVVTEDDVHLEDFEDHVQ